MAGDLGTAGGQVQRRTAEVLDFWFALSSQQQFAKDEALDRQVAARFGDWSELLIATDAAGHWDDSETLLAAIIGVDQFPRNLHRGSAAAFAGDELARRLTLHAIGQGWDESLPAERRVFLYMPLMHAEDSGMQALSVEKYEQLGVEENLRFAIAHRDAIERFGRFPGRNKALGRETTAVEAEWLQENDGGW